MCIRDSVYSVNSLTTIAVMFFYGMVQDRLGLKRHLVILSSAVMASLAPFVIFVYQPLLQNAFGWDVLLPRTKEATDSVEERLSAYGARTTVCLLYTSRCV